MERHIYNAKRKKSLALYRGSFLRVCLGSQNSNIEPCLPSSFQLNLACLSWFFHGERSSSFVNRKRVQSYTNNGILNPVDALLQIHLCLFSHSTKLRGLQLSAVTVSLHYLPTCKHVCAQQSHVARCLLQ